MKKFIESGLEFEFSENWEIFQYDESQQYRDVSNHLIETKAVDFLGFYENKSLVLFEIKNFCGSSTTPQAQQRFSNSMEELTTEIGQKVRDTIAVMTGVGHNQPNNESIWARFLKHIYDKKQILVIFWVEEDKNTQALKKRSKNEMSVRTDKLKKKLSWLTKYIFIESVKDQHSIFDGLRVRV